MDDDPRPAPAPAKSQIPMWAKYLLWAIVALTVIFGALIAVTPLALYRFAGHCFEAAAALICMAMCAYAYLRLSLIHI